MQMLMIAVSQHSLLDNIPHDKNINITEFMRQCSWITQTSRFSLFLPKHAVKGPYEKKEMRQRPQQQRGQHGNCGGGQTLVELKKI